ncbi:hypothetical protein [Sporosarcina aquimarina]|uniref:Uncharacterized protein n=1 Tax=Sporosarcina aquimarina TaxID=114975 RepID=A0ABU4FWT1_9BACL|nr:hypothetical protein [Sporosarcina aquimarina]MDW0109106.1 hypothetical protein [Sporosarcina aquimarina]
MDQKDNNDKLEELLRSMPKQADYRSKEEILERLKQDDRNFERRVQSRKKKIRWIPGIVAAAALLLLAILIPSLMNSGSPGYQSAEQAESETTSQDKAQTAEDRSADNELSKAPASESARFMKDTPQYAAYPIDVQDSKVLHLGLQDAQAVSIPISIMLTKDQLDEKGLTESSTDLELYNAFSEEIDESALGFEQLHPLDATFEEQGDELKVYLNVSHKYDQSSATQEVFFHSLFQTFPMYKTIAILDTSGKPAVFDQIGTLETLHIDGYETQTPYYIYKQESGKEFLSPNFMQPADSFKSALSEMKKKPNDLFEPIIPKGLEFTVSSTDDVATVEFKNKLNLDSMDMKETSQLIDGLALTAASFGIQVQLTNIEPLDWNGLDFREHLPVPIGANPMPLIVQ